jgi:hypothetical protein
MDEQFKYSFAPETYTRNELQNKVEAEVSSLPPGSQTWVDGDFDFNDWLIAALDNGTVVRI